MRKGGWETDGKTHLLITSSKSSTFPFLKTALARLKSCLCPCDRLSSSIFASSPPLPSITSHNSTFCRARTISSSVTEIVGFAFSRTLPSKMYGSCGTATREERTCSCGMVERGMLSIVMKPWEMGRRRRREDKREDLPLRGGLGVSGLALGVRAGRLTFRFYRRWLFSARRRLIKRCS